MAVISGKSAADRPVLVFERKVRKLYEKRLAWNFKRSSQLIIGLPSYILNILLQINNK